MSKRENVFHPVPEQKANQWEVGTGSDATHLSRPLKVTSGLSAMFSTAVYELCEGATVRVSS